MGGLPVYDPSPVTFPPFGVGGRSGCHGRTTWRADRGQDLPRLERLYQEDAAKSPRFGFQHHVCEGTGDHGVQLRIVLSGLHEQLESVELAQAYVGNEDMWRLRHPKPLRICEGRRLEGHVPFRAKGQSEFVNVSCVRVDDQDLGSLCPAVLAETVRCVQIRCSASRLSSLRRRPCLKVRCQSDFCLLVVQTTGLRLKTCLPAHRSGLKLYVLTSSTKSSVYRWQTKFFQSWRRLCNGRDG